MGGAISKLTPELMQEIIKRLPADVRNSSLTTSIFFKKNIDEVRRNETAIAKHLRGSAQTLEDCLADLHASGKLDAQSALNVQEKRQTIATALPPNIEPKQLRDAGYKDDEIRAMKGPRLMRPF